MLKQILRAGAGQRPDAHGGRTHQVSGSGVALGPGSRPRQRQGGATRVDYRNPEGEVFAMTIELVNQLLLITFAEQNQQQPDVKTTSRFARLLGLG